MTYTTRQSHCHSRAGVAIIAFTLYDVMGRRLYGRFMAWSAISVCYLVVIGALAALRARWVA